MIAPNRAKLILMRCAIIITLIINSIYLNLGLTEKVILERIPRPDVIISNGEGFPDYGAHSNTEISITIAARNLIEKGILAADTKYLQYAGVWERILY